MSTTATNKKAGYVPPHMRKEEAAKPVELNSESLSDATLFPSLGGLAPKSKPAWGKAAAAAAKAVPQPSTNAFAALAEDEEDAAAKPQTFKERLEERIRREKEDNTQEEEFDLSKMSETRLESLGYSVLKLPKKEDKAWYAQYNTSLAEDEAWCAENEHRPYALPDHVAAAVPVPDYEVALQSMVAMMVSVEQRKKYYQEVRRLDTYSY